MHDSGQWVASQPHVPCAMRSLVDAVCGCFLVMAALAAPGAALAAAEDGSDLPKLVATIAYRDGRPHARCSAD